MFSSQWTHLRAQQKQRSVLDANSSVFALLRAGTCVLTSLGEELALTFSIVALTDQYLTQQNCSNRKKISSEIMVYWVPGDWEG